MLNQKITIAATLSASNDYMTDVGLSVVVDDTLADLMLPHLIALAANIATEISEAQIAVFTTDDFPDRDDDASNKYTQLFALRDDSPVEHRVPYVTISVSPTNDPVVLDKNATKPQTDFLARLIREQLALCLIALGLDVTEARPYDN